MTPQAPSRIFTESGSVYDIDPETQWWGRTEGASPALRTKGGYYRELLFRGIGYPLVMICEPISPGAGGRLITTSRVVGYE